jgi:hypothetical protein
MALGAIRALKQNTDAGAGRCFGGWPLMKCRKRLIFHPAADGRWRQEFAIRWGGVASKYLVQTQSAAPRLHIVPPQADFAADS